MDGTEHQAGISESQYYLCNEAENKKNTGTISPAWFVRYSNVFRVLNTPEENVCVFDTLESLIKN